MLSRLAAKQQPCPRSFPSSHCDTVFCKAGKPDWSSKSIVTYCLSMTNNRVLGSLPSTLVQLNVPCSFLPWGVFLTITVPEKLFPGEKIVGCLWLWLRSSHKNHCLGLDKSKYCYSLGAFKQAFVVFISFFIYCSTRQKQNIIPLYKEISLSYCSAFPTSGGTRHVVIGSAWSLWWRALSRERTAYQSPAVSSLVRSLCLVLGDAVKQ